VRRHLLAALLLAPLASCAWWDAPIDNPSQPPTSGAPEDPGAPTDAPPDAPKPPTKGDGVIGVFQAAIAILTGNPTLAVALGAAAKIGIDAARQASKKPKAA